jgi:tetratricopeptide (TPR) repeat protein
MMSETVISKRRLWLFRIISVTIIPFAFLALVEAGLRIFQVGYPTDFFLECEVNEQKAYCNNDKFGWLYFPPKVARPPVAFSITKEKPANTYRVFVLGGSSAQGDPEHTFGVSQILSVMLRQQYPGLNFEILNAAMAAINSHVVLQIAKDCAKRQGDLFIVYLGNNEVIGPYGAGTVFSPLPSNLFLIRAGILLKSTRIGQILAKLFTFLGHGKEQPKTWAGMEMFLGKQVRSDAPSMEKLYHYFQRNLEEICRVAGKNGIKTIVSTVGTNLKNSPPFASLHRMDMTKSEEEEWITRYQAGIELESAGMYDQAIREYLKAAQIDDRFANLQYRLGRCYWYLGRYIEARPRFFQAQEFDTLRFRADIKINKIIRKVATSRSSKGVYLVDAVKAFEANSPHGTQGNELFYEHVHMNFTGNYILARELFQQIENILPAQIKYANSGLPLLDEEECAQRLAFTGYDRYRVALAMLGRISRPPFINQLYREQRFDQMQKQLENLKTYTTSSALAEATAQYRQATEYSPQNVWLRYNFAELLLAANDPAGAAHELRIFLRDVPLYVPANERLIKVLISQRKYDDALSQCNRTLQIKPGFAPVYYHMAYILLQKGLLDQGIETYRKLLRLDPEETVEIYNQIGLILIRQNRLQEAAEEFRKAIAFHTKSMMTRAIADVHFNLADVLKKMSRIEEAVQELRKAEQGFREELIEHPDSAETHLVLGKTMAAIGDIKEAVEHFRQAVELNPANLGSQFNLIKFLEAQGRLDAAIEATEKAIRLMQKDGQASSAARLQKHLAFLKAKQSRKKIKG